MVKTSNQPEYQPSPRSPRAYGWFIHYSSIIHQSLILHYSPLLTISISLYNHNITMIYWPSMYINHDILAISIHHSFLTINSAPSPRPVSFGPFGHPRQLQGRHPAATATSRPCFGGELEPVRTTRSCPEK